MACYQAGLPDPLLEDEKAPGLDGYDLVRCDAVMPITLLARYFALFADATVPTQFLIVIW